MLINGEVLIERFGVGVKIGAVVRRTGPLVFVSQPVRVVGLHDNAPTAGVGTFSQVGDGTFARRIDGTDPLVCLGPQTATMVNLPCATPILVVVSSLGNRRCCIRRLRRPAYK